MSENECGDNEEIGGMKLKKEGNDRTPRKPCFRLISSPRTPHGVTDARTRDASGGVCVFSTLGNTAEV